MRIFDSPISRFTLAQVDCRTRGFTLIEVLVVVVMVGVIMSVVVGAFASGNANFEIEGYVERMALRFELGRDRAIQSNREWGIYVERDEISFAEFDPITEQWLPVALKQFNDEGNPLNLRFDAKVEAFAEQLQSDDEELPDIILFSSGETSPFQLSMSAEDNEQDVAPWRLHSDGFTRTAWDRERVR